MIWFCLTVVYIFSLTIMMGNFAVNGIWVPDEDANLVFFLSVAPITNTVLCIILLTKVVLPKKVWERGCRVIKEILP